MPSKQAKLLWSKYLTREYSFLYISYASDCYKIMKQTVGTTITYDLSHGEGKLVSLYGIQEDIRKSYQVIEEIAKKDPQDIVRKMDYFDNLINRNYQLFKEIRTTRDKDALRELLTELDRLFLKTLCHYLFFVFLGYAGDLPSIKKFLIKHGKRFNKIRLYTIDADMNKQFPKLFARYDKKLAPLASYMWRGELIDYIEGKKVDLQRIKNRQKRYLIITKAGKTKEYKLSEINDILTKELAHLQTSKVHNQVKGRIAYKGKSQGRAVVVFTTKDYKKIKKGDVLITPMTKPEIVPFLTKVAGIVTNDGGALSHASIISREMKIPCIVGTGNATDVFKDGETIRLDGEKGIAIKV